MGLNSISSAGIRFQNCPLEKFFPLEMRPLLGRRILEGFMTKSMSGVFLDALPDEIPGIKLVKV